MTYRNILVQLFARGAEATPQCIPLPGQVPNDAGGYVYALDDWARLDRFLVLGTEDGTYYVSAVELTRRNAGVVLRCVAADGARTVARVVEVSRSGRAPKNEPALFALALCAAAHVEATRKAALAALPQVARTGAHVLAFVSYVQALRGWGRGLRRAVAGWFVQQPAERLALQAVKYGQREGWALRDLLRLAHPLTDDAGRRALIDWIAHPDNPEAVAAARNAFRLVEGLHAARVAESDAAVAETVRRFSLPREALPTESLNSREVWDALLVDMPMTAMIRNLGKMTAVGLLTPWSEAARYVAERLGDRAQLTAARVHPIQLLLALKTYAAGCGERGRLAWTPVAAIVEALDAAFHQAFTAVEPTGRRVLVAVDVSGSMHGSRCAGSPGLSCMEAAAAVAMQFVRVERHAHVVAFDTDVHQPAVTPTQRLDDVARSLARWNGGTDVAAPIAYALGGGLVVDAFVVITDNETWAGREHPVQALARYRQRLNPAAKIAVLAAAANRGAVVKDDDPLAFGACGFDAAVPQLVADFIRG
jgi:60 kDa SS-A/Ro ribonucleoprotein